MTCLPFYTGIENPLNYFFAIFNLFSSIICTTGNIIVISSLSRRRQLNTSQNFYIKALAASDLVCGLLAQPVYGVYIAFFSDANICILELCIVYVSASCCASSILLLCAIARDRLRCFSIVLNETSSSNKHQKTIITVCFTFGLLTGATFMLNEGWMQYLGFSTFVVIEFGSFVVIVYTYLQVRAMVKEQGKNILNRCNDSGGNKRRESSTKEGDPQHYDSELTLDNNSSQINSKSITVQEINPTGLPNLPIVEINKPHSRFARRRSTMAASIKTPSIIKSILKREERANTTIFIVIVVYVIMWFPFMVTLSVGFWHQVTKSPFSIEVRRSFMWTAIFTYVNGTLNPFIYATRYREIRNEMAKVISSINPFSRTRPRRVHNDDSRTNGTSD